MILKAMRRSSMQEVMVLPATEAALCPFQAALYCGPNNDKNPAIEMVHSDLADGAAVPAKTLPP